MKKKIITIVNDNGITRVSDIINTLVENEKLSSHTEAMALLYVVQDEGKVRLCRKYDVDYITSVDVIWQ